MSDIFVGRVIKVHQRDNSLDIQLSCDDSVLTGVPLIGPMMTSSSGLVDMHHPEGNTQDGPGSKTRDCCVIVARTNGGFIALGFLSLQVNQMAFNRKNFKVSRHASDVYNTIDDSGNIELSHPSGTFVRVATSPAHENLDGQDADGLWSANRNKSAKVWLSVVVANDSGVMADIKIDPSGNVTLLNKGDLTITTKGDAILTAKSVTINGKTTINGVTTINGATAITGPTLTHNGVNSGGDHIHGGVTSGAEFTEGPGSPPAVPSLP